MRVRERTVSKTLAAAGDYAANDVVSESATADAGTAYEFSQIAPRHGWPFALQSAFAQSSEDSLTWRLRLHLFNAEPLAAEVEMDDNAAFDIKTAAGRNKYLGYIDLPAFIDLGAAASGAQATQLEHMVDPDNGDTIWIVVETLDAEANETASMTLAITLNASE